jgi:hypothetical protein
MIEGNSLLICRLRVFKFFSGKGRPFSSTNNVSVFKSSEVNPSLAYNNMFLLLIKDVKKEAALSNKLLDPMK